MGGPSWARQVDGQVDGQVGLLGLGREGGCDEWEKSGVKGQLFARIRGVGRPFYPLTFG